MSHLRREVLKQFKSLHRTRQYIFQDDTNALDLVRTQINQYFRKNKQITDEAEIKNLIKLAQDVENELKTNVIQAVQKEPGVFRVRVTEHTPMLENVVFNENAIILPPRGQKCGEKKDEK